MLKQKYTWSGLDSQAKQWAKQCELCQKAKIWRHTKAPLHDIPTTARFRTVHIDLVGPFPPYNSYEYLVTMVDRFTRWAEVVPVKDQSAANAFMQAWISRFGVPITLIGDRVAQFESALWSALMHKLGINRKRTKAYHPANGAIERFLRTLKNAL